MCIRFQSMAFHAMVLLYLIAALVCTGCGAQVYEAVATAETASDPAGSEAAARARESVPEVAEQPGVIGVYICGEVKRTGVYELPEGARVRDVILAAGGLTEEADETAVNQAGYVSDGQQITVPGRGEVPAGGYPDGTGGETAAGLVNLNTAGVAELMTLSGIGEARARDIIAYREASGPFTSIEDIMKVSGIKTSLYEKIRDRVTVG